MNKEEIQQITEYIDKIAEKIGVLGVEVWPWSVKQQIIEGVKPILLFVFMFPIFCWFLKKIYKRDFKWCGSTKDFTGFALCILFGFMSLVAVIDFLVHFSGLINPEYAALKDLIGMFK